MKQVQFDLFAFSRFRNELMGVATLLIILCHATKFNLVMPSWLFTLLGNCGAGVDIFLFLSGMGIFNSYANREVIRMPIYKWLWKRYLRIIIPCAFFIVPLTVLESLLSSSEEIDIIGILLNLSGFGFLFGKGALWFVTCILLLYLITPIINKLMKSKNKYLYTYFLCIASLLFGYIHFSENGAICKLQFILCRFPSYFIGYAMAKEIKNQQNVAVWKLVLLPFLCYGLFFMLNHSLGTHFSLFWLQGMFLISFVTLMLKNNIVSKCFVSLRFLGSVSLESYATNIMVIPLFFGDYSFMCIDSYSGRWGRYVIGTLFCLAISFIVNRLSKYLIKQIV